MSTIPSEKTLRDLYDAHSDKEIAAQHSVSEATVRRWRRKYGIKSKPRGPRTTKGVSRVTDEEITAAVPNSLNWSDLLRNVGLGESGSARHGFRQRVKARGLDTTHFSGRNRRIVLGHTGRKAPISEFLRNPRKVSSSHLKGRLIQEGMLENRCAECGQDSTWNGKHLVMQLDHIDGDRLNNLLENLRVLSTNCHSQTPTYRGKNKGNID